MSHLQQKAFASFLSLHGSGMNVRKLISIRDSTVDAFYGFSQNATATRRLTIAVFNIHALFARTDTSRKF